MLGDGGLGDAELGGHPGSEGPGRLLAVAQQLDEAATDGIAEDVECVHAFI
ncbi:hypothetical protein GCM10009616_24060 [Microlunatus lacustris]